MTTAHPDRLLLRIGEACYDRDRDARGAHPLLFAAFGLTLAVAANAAARCWPCALAGPTQTAPDCVPKGGILVFNSVPPNVPAYWALHANRRRPLGRLDGRLRVWSDVVDPGVPGFPGEREDHVFRGASARFRGTVEGSRMQGVASYANGSTCDFVMTIGFGLGDTSPNAFVCRDRAGNLVAEGGVDLQLIRLRECRRPSRG